MPNFITFIDFFAGIGGFRKGLENAGHKCVGFCEWDKFATMSYISMHLLTNEQREYLSTLDFKKRQKEILDKKYLNGEWYVDDIKKVDPYNIPKADCYCFGAPCFVAGTLITTSTGMKPIEDIQIGDLVLTHNDTYEPVTERMINIKTGIYTLQVQGSPITECTGNHRFYVRYKTKHWNSDIHKYEYHWTVPEWKSVENFNGKEYIKCPNSQYSEIIDKELWQPVKKVQFDKNRTETVYNLEVENAHSYTANNLAAHNCQDFSVAGKRAGFDGDRSVLVREVFRIIREQNECDKPEWLIYENVKGMLSSNRGFDFLAILLEMDELGYDCEWQTFNTRYFGIPQNRERVYTVGHLRTRGTRKLFPFQSSSGTNSSTKINIIGHREGFRRNMQVFDPQAPIEAIDTGTGGGRGPHTVVPMGILRNVRNDYAKSIRKEYEQGNVEAKRSDLVEKEIRTDGIANTLDTVQKDNLLAVGINNVGSVSKGQNGNVYGIDGISPALRSGQGVTGNGIGSNNSPKVAVPIDSDITTVKLSFSKGLEETSVSPTLMARDYKGVGKQTDIAGVAVHIPVMTPEKESKRAHGRRFKDNEDPSFTLTTIDRHGVAIGVEPKSSVYLTESDRFSTPFMENCSKTLKAGNDVGITLTVDVDDKNEDLVETTIVNKNPINAPINKNKGKNKSLFTLNPTKKQSEPNTKLIKGLYVKLNETTTVYCVWYEKYQQYIAIRKLTPKENFRLQGWSDEYFERAKFINSDSQLYKQAGNGVTVDVVEEIGKAIANQ